MIPPINWKTANAPYPPIKILCTYFYDIAPVTNFYHGWREFGPRLETSQFLSIKTWENIVKMWQVNLTIWKKRQVLTQFLPWNMEVKCVKLSDNDVHATNYGDKKDCHWIYDCHLYTGDE